MSVPWGSWLIESWEELPRGSVDSPLPERVWFDVKRRYEEEPGKRDRRTQMAKDIAAFANASGGVIIVGAVEAKDGPDYTSAPLSRREASQHEKAFDEAVRDFCSPSPTVHVRTIAVPSQPERVILTVGVEPFLDQPVGARWPMNANGGRGKGDAWLFPLRVGRDTEWIAPEGLGERMNAKTRTARFRLERAVATTDGQVDVFHAPATGGGGYIQGSSLMHVRSIDHDGGGSVVLEGVRDLIEGKRVAVPLDDLEAVWLQLDGRWAIRISGRPAPATFIDAPDEERLIYVPPGTSTWSPLAGIAKDAAKAITEVARALRDPLRVREVAWTEPPEDQIRAAAHAQWAWRSEHGFDGSAEDDWERARENLIRARLA